MLKNNRLYMFVLALCIIAITLTMAILINLYHVELYDHLYRFGEKRLEESLTYQQSNLKEIFKRETASVELLGRSLMGLDSKPAIVSALTKHAERTDYVYMFISDTQGNAITNNNVLIDISGQEILDKVITTRQSCISEPTQSLLNSGGEQEIIIASPVFFENKLVAVVGGAYTIDYIESLIVTGFDGSVHYILFTGRGTPILSTYTCNTHSRADQSIQKVLYEGEYIQSPGLIKSELEWTENIKVNASGKIKIKHENNDYTVLFEPLGVSDWFLMTLAPDDAILPEYNSLNLYNSSILFIFFTILLILAFYIIFSKLKIAKKLIAAFIITSVIASISGVTGGVILIKSYREYSNLLDEHSFALMDISTTALIMSDARSYMGQLVFMENPEEIDSLSKKVDECAINADIHISAIKEKIKTPRALELYNQFEEYLSNYRADREEIKNTMLQGSSYSIICQQKWFNDCLPQINKCIDTLNELIDLNIQSTYSADARLKNNATMTILTIIFVILSAFTFSVLLAYFISKSLSLPLSQIEKAAMCISENNMDFKLDTNLNDEIGTIANVLNTNVRNAFIQLNEKNRLLDEQNKTIFESLSYARKIQNSLLPSTGLLSSVFSDYHTLWKPRDTVGGDIYWASSFDKGTILFICDCTGHGTPGALLSMLAISIINSVVNIDNCDDLKTIVWECEQKFSNIKSRNKSISSEIDDNLDFIIFFIDNGGNIQFAAKNMRLFICNGKEVSVKKGQRPKNKYLNFEDKNDIIINTTQHNENNKFYIATDGLFDQVGEETGLPFGYAKFESTILTHHNKTCSEISVEVWNTFSAHIGNERRRDDLTLIAFSI